MKPPKKWKMAIVIWMAIYPIITTIFFFFGKDLMTITPLPIRTLCLTLIVVPLAVFIVVPLLQKVLGGWLKK